MKKITLFFGLSLLSLIGFAQQANDTSSISDSLEREIEYIIVLDDVTVDGNIDKLLNDNNISGDFIFNSSVHELAHDTSGSIDIESKFIEGAFSYNEYALNYSVDSDSQVSVGS